VIEYTAAGTGVPHVPLAGPATRTFLRASEVTAVTTWEAAMPAMLSRMHAEGAWLSYLGASGSCLSYLGSSAARFWVSGASGYAFFIQMMPDGDFAGPIGFTGLCVHGCTGEAGSGSVVHLLRNAGCASEAFCHCPFGGREGTIDWAREEAWRLVRDSIDRGLPCIGFDVDGVDFAPVCGYDDQGYYALRAEPGATSSAPRGPVPWQTVGATIGWVRFQSIARCEPAPDEVTVGEGLRAAHQRATEGKPMAGGAMGPDAFDLWAQSLETGTIGSPGHRYCAAVYAELRRDAVAFLREAQERLPGRADALFVEALRYYELASERLDAVHALHPPVNGAEGTLRCPEAAGLLRQAGAAERRGLPILAAIAERLV